MSSDLKIKIYKFFWIISILIFCIGVSIIDSKADSTPPLPEQYNQPNNSSNHDSLYKKLKNFISNIFSSSKQESDTPTTGHDMLSEDLADLIKHDIDVIKDENPKPLLVEEKNTSIDNKIKMADDGEAFSIPLLPEDGQVTATDKNNQQNPNIASENTKNEQTSVITDPNLSELNESIDNKFKVENVLVTDQMVNDQVSEKDANKPASEVSSTIPVAKSGVSTTEDRSIALRQELAEIKNSKTIPSPSQKEMQIIDTDKNNIATLVKNEQDKDSLIEKDKFITDEAKVLLLPEDDVVLGKISLEARAENMNDYNYIDLFSNLLATEDFLAHDNINNFIHNYNNNHKQLSAKEALINAFEAIRTNNLSELRILLDIYPILQKTNSLGQNLLHYSVRLENYSLTEFLILRGININAYDYKKNSPLSIAVDSGNENIILLLDKAGAK